MILGLTFKIYPKPRGVERSYTVIGGNFFKIIYDNNGKSIGMKVWSLSQIDAKVNPLKARLIFLLKTYNSFYTDQCSVFSTC